jgi:hypothetical protein
MAKNNKNGFTNSVLSLVFLVPKLFSFVNNIGALIKAEAQHAKRNLILIVFLILISVILVTSTWLCLLGLLYLYLTTHLAPIPSLTIVLAFNIFLLIIIGLVIYLSKRNLFFPATFSQISKARFRT